MKEDIKWQTLLAASAPTFTGETTPPYGFMTSTLARLRSERQDREQIEKIGFRALVASFAAFASVLAFTLILETTTPTDAEPGVRSILQIANLPVS